MINDRKFVEKKVFPIQNTENKNKEKQLICTRTNEALIQREKKKFKSAYAVKRNCSFNLDQIPRNLHFTKSMRNKKIIIIIIIISPSNPRKPKT